MSPVEVLDEHVRLFNEAIRTGDFGPMLALFAADAELAFEGVPVGPFSGRVAIAAAYAAQPPDDEVRLLGEPRVDGDVVETDYLWLAEATRAGRMVLTVRDGAIARLLVTFES